MWSRDKKEARPGDLRPVSLELSALETPCILINLDIVEEDNARMQEKANRCGVVLRPHMKAHKIPELVFLHGGYGFLGTIIAVLLGNEVVELCIGA